MLKYWLLTADKLQAGYGKEMFMIEGSMKTTMNNENINVGKWSWLRYTDKNDKIEDFVFCRVQSDTV